MREVPTTKSRLPVVEADENERRPGTTRAPLPGLRAIRRMGELLWRYHPGKKGGGDPAPTVVIVVTRPLDYRFKMTLDRIKHWLDVCRDIEWTGLPHLVPSI